MRPGARLSAATELLELIHQSWENQRRIPADALIADFFKQRRYMGSKDRGFVAELVYYVLRQGGALQWWLEQAELPAITPRQIILLALVMGFEHSPHQIQEWCDGKEYAPAKLTEAEKKLLNDCADQPLTHAAMPDWARYNMPGWLISKFRADYGDDFESEITALSQDAPIDLRVNTLKCPDRSDAIMALDRTSHYGTPTPYSEFGIRMKKRLPVFALDPFRQGWFEVQDEGSQLIAALVEAEAGQKVVDFCAGAGGKTLAIAARMENKGRICAWDINETRLNQIKKRLARAGVDNVLLHVIKSTQDSFLKRHKDTADWVLVDAPCSGCGTWRRNPDLKWRMSAPELQEMVALQREILGSAARLVKGGGALVYATCSMLSDENQQQIEWFLAEHPDFKLEPLGEQWRQKLAPEADSLPYLSLSPARTQTDGFFAAVMRKSTLM